MRPEHSPPEPCTPAAAPMSPAHRRSAGTPVRHVSEYLSSTYYASGENRMKLDPVPAHLTTAAKLPKRCPERKPQCR